MSIRNINKDQLRDRASLELVTPEHLPLPDHKDPLKFWTQHETENTLVDLTVFAQGELKRARSSGRWAGPFAGRPKLILQLTPAIETATLGCTKATTHQIIMSLRKWWRLFDAVEQAAEQVEQQIDRVEDVRQLTHVHLDFVYRSGMDRNQFHIGYSIVNATLKSLGAPALYWGAPESSKPERHLPPEDQIKVIRIALKQEWETVRRHWALQNRIRADGFEPQTDEEFSLLKHWQHFANVQGSSGKMLPTSDELRVGYHTNKFAKATGMELRDIRTIIFPSRWEAETAFHLCLANTGWNPAVLYSLDASQHFLRTHPRDPSRYLLIGTKARAGGKEQPVNGLWKTKSGPGFIIRMWMERIAPLREQVKTMLMDERTRYAQMAQGGASADELMRQLKKIHKLEAGYRSVWLFVNYCGAIEWLDARTTTIFTLDSKRVTYMTVLVDRLNSERATRSEAPIAAVRPSDFRDLFALYVWRMTGGNILALMRALNHAQLRTTQDYADNNILNAERNNQARTFLDHLFDELGAGRVDITILAHLQRHGEVSNEMGQRLTEFRAQQRSRMGVACKDPFHPPIDIQPASAGKRMCGSQRCLICKPHAVILPESMSGIAMRIEELEAMQIVLPVGIWLESRFSEELRNGLDVLKLFPPDKVLIARDYWAQAIENGSHHIPGLHQPAT